MPKVIYIQYNLCKNKDFIYRKILYLVNLKAGQDGEPQALEKKTIILGHKGLLHSSAHG